MVVAVGDDVVVAKMGTCMAQVDVDEKFEAGDGHCADIVAVGSLVWWQPISIQGISLEQQGRVFHISFRHPRRLLPHLPASPRHQILWYQL